jgi:putative DNA methylase
MYWRRRLPHWVPDDSIVFVTWRLAGTLPQPLAEIAKASRPGVVFLLHDRELDRAKNGPHWLKDPRIAGLVAEALLHGEANSRLYELYAWAVMPNHVHVVLKPIETLPVIMRWLKAATANRANRLLDRTGSPFWQREYFDRWVRSQKELASVISYVEQNPVAAGLTTCAEEWPWSSAGWKGPVAAAVLPSA